MAYGVFAFMTGGGAIMLFLIIAAAAHTPIPSFGGFYFFGTVTLIGVIGLIGTFISGLF